jgi:hypothetical protein
MNKLINQFDDDRKYRGYVADVLTLFGGDINYDDIHSIYPDTLKKLVKIKQNDVDKITELEKENKELTEYFNSNELLLKMRKVDKKLDSVVDIIKDSVDEDSVKRIKYSLYKELLPEFDWNKIEDMVNEVKEEYSNKNKIKVYIKEEGVPEYIQLWDKFHISECYNWLDWNKYDGRNCYSCRIDNMINIKLQDGKKLSFKTV